MNAEDQSVLTVTVLLKINIYFSLILLLKDLHLYVYNARFLKNHYAHKYKDYNFEKYNLNRRDFYLMNAEDQSVLTVTALL